MSDLPYPDLMRALYEEAGREADAERAAQLRRDADILKDVWDRLPYALAPSRDQMQRAVGNATLDIADALTAIARDVQIVKHAMSDMHTSVQHNDTLVSATLDAVRGVADSLGKDVATLREGQERILEHQQERDALEDERYAGRLAFEAQSSADREQLNTDVGVLKQDVSEIKSVLAERPAARAAEQNAMHQWQARIESRLAELEARRRAHDGDA